LCMAKIVSIDPSNNKEIVSTTITTEKEIITLVQKSKKAQLGWGALSVKERIKHIKSMFDVFKANEDKLVNLISKEMGKGVTSARGSLDFYFENLQWYIDNAERCLQDEILNETKSEISKIVFEPKGVVASIIPWNYPFGMFVWQGCQNLIAGNTVIMKPSEFTSLTGKLIADLIEKSSLPKDVFITIYGDGKVGEILVNQDIDLICFTGSTAVGQLLYKKAAEKFIPALMELGGSAAGIVFDDVDVDHIVDSIYENRFLNNGQSCDALKRLLVHESKFDIVVEKLKKLVTGKVVGKPSDTKTDIGPLVSKRHFELVASQVDDAINKGAKVICGGKKLNLDNGNYYEPTILTNIKKDMRVWNEEVFGPVLPIMPFKTFEQAIELANDTRYGLGGYIFTSNKNTFEKASRLLKTGGLCQNNLSYVQPQNPFGGTKMSGLGRNNGKHGFQELCNLKVITCEK